MSAPPAGWLEDPDDPQRLRWWDGTQWTEHRKPLEAAAVASPANGTSTGAEAPPREAPGRGDSASGDRDGGAATSSAHAAGTVGTVGDVNTLAIGSLAAALIWGGGLGSIAAIVMGVVARRQIAEAETRQRGDGLALAGIVVGVLGLVIPLLVLAGLSSGGDQAVPPGATGQASDAEVEEALRGLHDAQASYHEEHGRYADEEELRTHMVGDVDGDIVFGVETRGDGYCIDAFPAAGGRPQSVTHEDPSPRSSSC